MPEALSSRALLSGIIISCFRSFSSRKIENCHVAKCVLDDSRQFYYLGGTRSVTHGIAVRGYYCSTEARLGYSYDKYTSCAALGVAVRFVVLLNRNDLPSFLLPTERQQTTLNAERFLTLVEQRDPPPHLHCTSALDGDQPPYTSLTRKRRVQKCGGVRRPRRRLRREGGAAAGGPVDSEVR